MFAVIETGGKQYKVEDGLIIDIEKIDGEPTSFVTFDKVLLHFDGKTTQIGTPYIEGYKVTAKVLNQIRDKKKIVFKFKSKTGYKKKQGHRQSLTTIKIDSITASKGAPKTSKASTSTKTSAIKKEATTKESK